jgi:uncharacterized protein (TIGR02266 family)
MLLFSPCLDKIYAVGKSEFDIYQEADMSSDYFSDKKSKDDVIIENRINKRFESDFNIDFELSAGGPHNFFSGFTQDISEGGVFLATHQVYPIGTEMALTFTIEGTKLNIKSIVRWVRNPDDFRDGDVSPGMGLQFLEMNENDQSLINKYIANHETLFVDLDD